MPVAEVVAVPTPPRGAGGGAEIVEVGVRVLGGAVLAVAGSGTGPVPKTTPGEAVTVLELRGAAIGIGQIPGHHHRAGDGLDEFGRCLVSRVVAGGDVRRPDDDRVLGDGSRGSSGTENAA